LEESGVNLIEADVAYGPSADSGAEVVERLTVTQKPWAIEGQPEPSLRPHRLAIGFYSDNGEGRLVRTHTFPLDLDSAEADVPEAVGVPRPAVIVVNDADLTYAKVRFDAESLATATARLSDFDDSLTQLLVLSTLWDGVRDAEIPARDYIDTLLSHLAAITHSSGLLTQMRQLETAVGAYLPPAERAEAHTRIADRLGELFEAAPAGTDQ
ncbi:aminopeptidase N, partial [Geobacillus sp. MMMUD3]|nr:aminopeptidase N [Geobacillus sp. MMMUD3]